MDTHESLTFSTDKSLLDKKLVYNYLSRDSYWAKGRSESNVLKSIENSLCFGAYFNEEQVGFARVVTDYAVFAWILDVFILDQYQHRGFGKILMETIMNHEELQGLQRWGLNTFDAHKLYKKYGFKSIERPEVYMEIVHPPS